MINMKQCDWVCLARIARGGIDVSSANAPSRARLEAMQYIVVRPRDTLAITGLGRDVLIRRQYGLGPPAE